MYIYILHIVYIEKKKFIFIYLIYIVKHAHYLTAIHSKLRVRFRLYK
jgi:hypothetical protein